jgi:hypothetical protein
LIDAGLGEQHLATAKAGDVVPYVFGHTLVTPLTYTIVDKGNGQLLLDLIISQGVCETIDKVVIDGEVFDISDTTRWTVSAMLWRRSISGLHRISNLWSVACSYAIRATLRKCPPVPLRVTRRWLWRGCWRMSATFVMTPI